MGNRPQTPDLEPSPVIMTPVEAETTFDDNAHIAEVQAAAHRKSLPQFIQAANLQPTDNVLDLGCGIGWTSHFAAPKCQLVIGIDISTKSLEKAVISASNAGLTNVAFSKGNITDAHLLRHAINRAKVWTTALLNSPPAIARGLNDITPQVPTAIPQKFNVVFLCWVMHILDRDTQRRVFTLLRDHFLCPGGRIITTWATPTTRVAFLAAGIGLRNPNGLYPHISATLHEYVGHRDDVNAARQDLRLIVHETGYHMDRCGVFPDWHQLDHVRDATAEIRARAQERSQRENPGWQWLEVARLERLSDMIPRLKDDDTYKYLKHIQRADQRCDISPVHATASVVAVLSVAPPS